MAPPATASDDSHQQLLDRLDIAHLPRPFRNPNWKPSQRRNKNVKQLLAETSRKEASVMATQNNSGAATPGAAGTGATTQPPSGGAIAQAAENLSNLVREKNARSMYPSGPAVTYTNIESAPSLHPSHQKHYCDITGLPAPYTDPKTRLRYHDKEIFGVVRTLGQGVAESYLESPFGNTGLVTLSLRIAHYVGLSKSSPFHPPCPFRDRLKKALRLNRNPKGIVLRHVLEHSTGTDIPQKGISVTTSIERCGRGG
ncbi:hypothetical protein DTO045G8_7768 [Paecilomyces variotii]|nr:hypothetical protein DTO045G8_7768 [Paecilomyces variotii]